MHLLVASEEEAKAIIESIKGGADFGALAKEKSTDKGSGANGGELGWFTADVMVKEFSDAAFAMQKGEVSKDPVKSQFGWHVILVEDRRAREPSFAEKEAELRDELARKIVMALLDDARAGATIERFNIDGSPRSQ